MVNVIAELEQRNKQLLEKEENLKLKIWHLTGQPSEDSYTPGHWWYKNLNKKWMDEGKLRMAIDPNETREWAQGSKRVYFDNITIEEMLDEFIDSSKEVAEKCSHYISRWSERGYENTRQRKEFEKKIAELNKYKEQVEDLAGEVRMLLFGYSKLSEEEIEKERIYWQVGEPKELLEKICGEYSKLSEVIMRIIDKWETDAKTHFISFTETSKEFNDNQREELREDSENKAREIEEKSKRLREAKDRTNEQELLIKKLQQELEDKTKKLEESRKKNKEQETQIGELKRSLHYAINKPLPPLPRKVKQNKFHQLVAKTKTSFQKFVEKAKNQKHELVARIEIKTS